MENPLASMPSDDDNKPAEQQSSKPKPEPQNQQPQSREQESLVEPPQKKQQKTPETPNSEAAKSKQQKSTAKKPFFTKGKIIGIFIGLIVIAGIVGAIIYSQSSQEFKGQTFTKEAPEILREPVDTLRVVDDVCNPGEVYITDVSSIDNTINALESPSVKICIKICSADFEENINNINNSDFLITLLEDAEAADQATDNKLQNLIEALKNFEGDLTTENFDNIYENWHLDNCISDCNGLCNIGDMQCEEGFSCINNECVNPECPEDADCVCALCGDGEVNQAIEECDDGNNIDGDGCSTDCQIPDTCDQTCVAQIGCQGGFDCINGNCRNPECPEEADCTCPAPGPLISDCGDRCDGDDFVCEEGLTCSEDGVCVNVECPEEADCTCPAPGPLISDCGDRCDGDDFVCEEGLTCSEDGVCVNNVCPDEADCICAECGNGSLDEGEECDDGNNVNGDGCSANCTVEVDPPECGDGEINQDFEECDDGNNINGDGCSADCLSEDEPPSLTYVPPECGDGEINQEFEECDDGNNVNGDGCSADCLIEDEPPSLTYTPPECGDGEVNQAIEECDDGNNADGDGCSANCQLEEEPPTLTYVPPEEEDEPPVVTYVPPVDEEPPTTIVTTPPTEPTPIYVTQTPSQPTIVTTPQPVHTAAPATPKTGPGLIIPLIGTALGGALFSRKRKK